MSRGPDSRCFNLRKFAARTVFSAQPLRPRLAKSVWAMLCLMGPSTTGPIWRRCSDPGSATPCASPSGMICLILPTCISTAWPSPRKPTATTCSCMSTRVTSSTMRCTSPQKVANGRACSGIIRTRMASSQKQILGGMSGGLAVDGFETLFPIVRGLPERFFLIKHAEPGGDREIISINGQLNPDVQIQPGELQFWRIANIGATLFIKFEIEGMPLYVMAIDGHPRSRPDRTTEFFVGPGQRIDVIAIGPPAGAYAMHTISFQNQAWKTPDPPQQLATIVSEGSGTPARDTEKDVLNQRVASARWFDEVRSTPIAHRRTLVYSRTPDRRVFMINGRVMDENRVDQTVKLGDTEEWTVINTDQQYHSFHIHQTGFLVSEVNGIRQNEDSLRDTYSMLPATGDGPSVLKVVIPFTDPVIVGRFVYHCHAVDHEDKGMMGVIEVTP